MSAKRFAIAFLLIGLVAGLFKAPMALAACQTKARMHDCCQSMGKNSCCPVKKTESCPVLEKATAPSWALVPASTTLCMVMIAMKMPADTGLVSLTQHDRAAAATIDPPTQHQHASPSLRSPPSLA